MAGLSGTIFKRFFQGNNYYALGRKIVNGEGKEEVIYSPVMKAPTERDIEKHLIGEITLGAYNLRQDNTVVWLCFDIDSPSDASKTRELTGRLDIILGQIPHAVEFSGRKGYHIWVFFKSGIEASRIRAIAGEIREAAGGKISGDPHVEIFPKQDELTDHNPLGNLVKVPLGLHPFTKTRSRFINASGDWEDGPPISPEEVLDSNSTVTLEDLAMCLDGYEDPVQQIVDSLSPHWTEGNRHDLALFLSGWLATSGWEEEDAMSVVEKLNQAAGGDLVNQLRCVTDTYRKFKDGGQVLGLQALSERLPGTALRRLAEAISRQNITPIMILIDKIRLGKGITYLKSRSAATAITSFLAEKGKVLIDQNSEKLYWLDKTSHHMYSMEDSWWDTLLYNTFGLNTTDSFGMSTSRGVYHTARENAAKVQTYSRSYWDGDNLWVNLGSSYNYVLSGDKLQNRDENHRWGRKILNGEEGIIFRTRESGLHLDLDQAWEKGIQPLNPWKYLVNDLSFGFGSTGVNPQEQKELIKAWFLSTFFPNIMPTRPLLTIIADPGAGKTTAARRFLLILEGPNSDVNGIVADKPDSLRASIAAHKYIVLDNLEKTRNSQALVDMLNRASTGTHIELRKLHTTNEIMRIKPDVFFILTATSLPFSEESLFTRLLPVELSAIRNPIPEYAMQRKITENLDSIWMGILTMLNETVAELRKVRTAPAPTQNRLADFSVFCARIRGMRNDDNGDDKINGVMDGVIDGVIDGETLIKGLEMMTNRQKSLLHESSPFVQILDIWLREDRENSLRQGKGESGGEAGKWHTASELNTILSRTAMRTNSQWIWDTGHSLSKHIQALEPNLIRSFGMSTKSATNNSPKRYKFSTDMIYFDTIEIPDNNSESESDTKPDTKPEQEPEDINLERRTK